MESYKKALHTAEKLHISQKEHLNTAYFDMRDIERIYYKQS